MSKFVDDLKDYNPFPICVKCKHHIKGAKCKAFDKIPKSILTGLNKHKKPTPNQNNKLVYKPE